MKFGITLANRGVLLGLITVPKLLALADAIDACALLDSIWVGDALFVNQRLDALTLLAVIAGGRTVLSVCAGGGSPAAWNAETEAMGIPAAERRKRMIENIAILRHLW